MYLSFINGYLGFHPLFFCSYVKGTYHLAVSEFVERNIVKNGIAMLKEMQFKYYYILPNVSYTKFIPGL